MNRIFKTVWNAARRALVVVNERTGPGQNRYVGMRASKLAKSRRRTKLVAVLGATVMLSLCGNVSYAGLFSPYRVSIGGIVFSTPKRNDAKPWVPEDNPSTSTTDDWSFDFDANSRGRKYELSAGSSTLWDSVATNSTQTLTGLNSTVLIRGGSGDLGIDGFSTLAKGESANVTVNIKNLTIEGGTVSGNTGIACLSREGGTAQIINPEGGTLTVQNGTSGANNHGIGLLATGSGSTGTITNGESGTLNILGNVDTGSYGIGTLTGDSAVGRVDNAGVMTLNKNAIQSFGKGDALVTNKGTVNAEVEAIFTKAEGAVSINTEIGLLSPEDGLDMNVTLEGFGSNGTAVSWSLKDDWSKHSVWEDGGILNITDVMEGSVAAQQIEAAFTELFGTGTKLNFLGEDDSASEGLVSNCTADTFTASVGNALIDQGYVGGIVTTFNLQNAASDGTAQALTVGMGEGQVIKDSFGFRQVEGVSSLTVNSGKSFALIGLPAGGELIEGGAPVTLDNGTLKLGVTPAESARSDSSTSGTLETVTMSNGSKIEAENMWIRIASVEGQGDISLTETGRVYVGNLNVTGTVKNEGMLSADTMTVSGALESSKVLKSDGRIRVDSSSKLVADGIVAADSMDVKGTVILGKDAQLYLGTAAVEQMRKAHADVAADLDRLEGKAEVSTLSVLDRIVAESMKRTEETPTDSDGETEAGESSSGGVLTVSRRATPALPKDAQAFAAFDAVRRIVSDIERGAQQDDHGLWVKLQTNESDFAVRSGSNFTVDSDGAVIGAEAQLDSSWKAGGAVSYLDGEIDSGAVKNNWTSYGMHAYVQYQEGAFGVKGTAGWLRGITEAAEDCKADVWHAGARAEYDVQSGAMTFTPFIGARVLSGSFDGMDSQTAYTFPVGAGLSGGFTAGGWTVVPSLEAAYVRHMGDTEAGDLRILPKDSLEGTLSLKASKGTWTGEISCRGATGNRSYDNRAFEVTLGMTF